MSATYTLYAHLPLTVTVGLNGSVTVTHPVGVVAMSSFSERGQRIAATMGTGVHALNNAEDATALPGNAFADLTAALS